MRNRKTERRKRMLQDSNRQILWIFAIMVLAICLAFFNIVYTAVGNRHLWSGQPALNPAVSKSMVTSEIIGKRGEILDRNDQVLVSQADAYNLTATFDLRTEAEKQKEEASAERAKELALENAKLNGNYEQVNAQYETYEREYVSPYVEDIHDFAKQVHEVLPDTSEEGLVELLEKGKEEGRSTIWLGAGTLRVDRAAKEALEARKIAGLGFDESMRRASTVEGEAKVLIGGANYDDESATIQGVYGLESSMNSLLEGSNGVYDRQITKNGTTMPNTEHIRKQAENGGRVKLTLDSNLQMVVDQQMQEVLESNEADAVWCLVTEIKTGKILAWTSLPTVDEGYHFDNIITAQECGSVIKPLVYASAIDAGVYPENKTYEAGEFVYEVDENNKIHRLPNGSVSSNPTIYDAGRINWGTLSFEDGLAHSSNIAICELLSNYLDEETFEAYMQKFGVYSKTGINFVPYEQYGKMNIHSASDYLSSGFGQASTVTPLTLTQAYTALFNNGVMMKPYIVDSVYDDAGELVYQFQPTIAGEPISSDSAAKVSSIMSHVTDPGMTGERFAIEGVDMLVKTGTGELYNPEIGTYDPYKYTSSVIAAAPANDPQILVCWGMVSRNYQNYSADPFKVIMQNALVCAKVASDAEQAVDPDGYQTWTMPSLVNHSTGYCAEQLDGKNVTIVTIGNGSSVQAQYPRAGSNLNTGEIVILDTGGSEILMPDLTGWTRKDLNSLQQMLNLSITSEGTGRISAQSIPPGTPIEKGTELAVTFS